VSDTYEPDPNTHPEEDLAWVFDDDGGEDDITDVDDKGYVPKGDDADGTDVIEGNEEFLWAAS
jgi:hypothetical protein